MGKKMRKFIDERIEGETGEVPLYRSYGVKKKVNRGVIFANVVLTKILFVLLVAFEFSVIAIVSFAMFNYGGPLASTLVVVVFGWLFFDKYTKAARRRLGFLRKFKKFCRKSGYAIEKKRGFFASLAWNESAEADFVLRAAGKTYFVKYVTPKRPLSSLTFLSQNEIRYTLHARKNVFIRKLLS